MRVDIFLKYPTQPNHTWHCYCQSVAEAAALRITETVEKQGEHVALFRTAKTLGKLVYETPDVTDNHG